MSKQNEIITYTPLGMLSYWLLFIQGGLTGGAKFVQLLRWLHLLLLYYYIRSKYHILNETVDFILYEIFEICTEAKQ